MLSLNKLGIFLVASLLTIACGGGGSEGKNSSSADTGTKNVAPIAAISSANNFVVIGLKEVVLDGSASSDSDGSIAKYQWSQISGSAVTLDSVNESSLRFTPGNLDEALTFQLTVTDDDGATNSTAVNVKVSPYFKQLSASDKNYCAIIAETNGDELYCWGSDITPPEVSNPTAIYSGRYNYCVVDDNGVQCWGSAQKINDVPSFNNVKKIAFSYAYACALDDDGVQCWGDSPPALPVFSNPVDIVGGLLGVCVQDDNGIACTDRYGEFNALQLSLSNVESMYGGLGQHFCAIDEEGLVCWDRSGNLFPSRDVTGVYTNITSVAMALDEICVLSTNDASEQQVSCFDDGRDSYGFIERMPSFNHPREIAANSSTACAIDDSGIVCWGYNYDDQTQPPAFETVNSLTSGFAVSCAIGTLEGAENTLRCWGLNSYDVKILPEYSNPIYISANDSVNCLIDENGPRCWGHYFTRTSGSSYDDFITKDIPLPDWNDVQAIEPGTESICAITSNNVECFGYNNYGELDVPELDNPIALTAGDTFYCAIDNSGVICWGNVYGKQFAVPTPVLTNPISLTAEDNHACAIADNKVHCWGLVSGNELNVPELVNPAKVVAGPRHNCAIDDNGVTCWGENSYGETNVPTLSNPSDITVGYHYSCAKDDTGLVCWGWQGFGGSPIPLKPQVQVATTQAAPVSLVNKNTLWKQKYSK